MDRKDDGFKISPEWTKAVCKLGAGQACCRYLAVDHASFLCLKYSIHANLLNQRVKNKTMSARGDNCDGFPVESRQGERQKTRREEVQIPLSSKFEVDTQRVDAFTADLPTSFPSGIPDSDFSIGYTSPSDDSSPSPSSDYSGGGGETSGGGASSDW